MFKYQIIAKDIQKKIEQGEFSPGEQLPQEIEMCKHYNASRITIREAMNQLVLLGLIIKRRGSGTFVKNVAEDMQNKDAFPKSSQFNGFTRDCAKFKVSSDIHNFSVINPPPEIAEQLKISPNSFTYYICRTRFIDNKPVVVEYTYMPIDIISGITLDIVSGSIYDYIEHKLNLKIKSAHRTARASMPTLNEKQWLNITEKIFVPIFEVEQIAYLDDGRIFEYSKSRHRADFFELKSVSVR